MRVATKVEYKELCRKIDHLAEEIKELQGAVAIEAIWGGRLRGSLGKSDKAGGRGLGSVARARCG